jgi:hypothetical protein
MLATKQTNEIVLEYVAELQLMSLGKDAAVPPRGMEAVELCTDRGRSRRVRGGKDQHRRMEA